METSINIKKVLTVFLIAIFVFFQVSCNATESSTDSSESAEVSSSASLDIGDFSHAIALDTSGGFAHIEGANIGVNSASISASIKVKNNLVYVQSTLGDTQNFVSCFQKDGKKLWEMSFESNDITIYPLKDDNCLIISGGELINVGLDGAVDWQTQLSGIKDCMVQSDGTILYLDGKYLGRILLDGSLEQITVAPPNAESFLPFSDDSFCIRNISASQLYSYDAFGKELWSYSAGNTLEIKNAVKNRNGDVITSRTLDTERASGSSGILRLLDQDGNLINEQSFSDDLFHHGNDHLVLLHNGTIAAFSDDNILLLDASLNVLKKIPVDHSKPIGALSFFSRGLTVLENGGFAVHYASAICAQNLDIYAILSVYQFDQDGEMVDKLHGTFEVENAFPDIYIHSTGRLFYENPQGVELRHT